MCPIDLEMEGTEAYMEEFLLTRPIVRRVRFWARVRHDEGVLECK